MDSVVRVPGWANIWTQPIINRIDMLATGVRTTIGVKVFGNNLDQIQKVSEEVAEVLRSVPGAVDVVPDQNEGKGYLEIQPDRDRAARYGVNVGDIWDVVEVALGGKAITTTVEGRERFPVRVRYARSFREDEEDVKNLLINAGSAMGGETAGGGMNDGRTAASKPAPAVARQIPLSMVADVRIVEGPAMIKSENGMLRSYVQLNVRDRDIVGFVEEAQRVVAQKVKLPPGMYLAWSGEFENQVRAQKTTLVVLPAVILVIFVILYLTYKDLVDALLMLMCVPEALVGGRLPALALRLPLQRGRAGGLHRLLRHGHGDGHHHARVSPRGDREARRPGKDRLAGRIARRGDRRGRTPAAAQALDRGRGDHRLGADALGLRRGPRDHFGHGRPRAGRTADRRRGGRHLHPRAVLLGPPQPLAEDAGDRPGHGGLRPAGLSNLA